MKLCFLFKVEKDLKQRQRTRDQTGGVGKPGVSLVGLQDHWGGGRLDSSWVDLVSVFEIMMRTSKRPKKVGSGKWWERRPVIDIAGDLLKRRDSLTRGVVRIHWALTLHKHLQACADPGRNIAMELNTGYGSRDIKTSLRQVFGLRVF